jgi:dipeptidyl aminopeptidase/acylaminoacyl peptidase
VILLPGLCLAASDDSARPTISDFAREPQYTSARLSPDGRHVAIVLPDGETTVLRLIDLEGGNVVANIVPGSKRQSVHDVRWAGKDRLVVSIARTIRFDNVPHPIGTLIGVDVDGGNQRILHHIETFEELTELKGFHLQDLPDADGQLMLSLVTTIGKYGVREPLHMDLLKIDARTGETVNIKSIPTDEVRHVVDAGGTLLGYSLSVPQGDPGKVIAKIGFPDEQAEAGFAEKELIDKAITWAAVRSVEKSTDRAYIEFSRNGGPVCVGLLQPSSMSLAWESCPQHSDYRWLQLGAGEKPVAVYSPFPEPKLLAAPKEADTTVPSAMKAMLAAFPGRHVRLVNRSEDSKKWLFELSSDRLAGELLILDAATNKVTKLVEARPWLDASRLGRRVVSRIKGRDSQALDVVMTYPPDGPRSSLPLLVVPHGGPHSAADSWFFDSHAQFAASRGVAVLQVNFRGSSGYGQKFEDGHYGQWSSGVQQDIIDATQWAIDAGIARPDRIAIAGSSFGGYSSVMAPIAKPGMFRATFANAGLYDIAGLMKHEKIAGNYWTYWSRVFGKDKAGWKSQSPLARASEVKIPTVLLHGDEDYITPIEGAKALRRALKKSGTPVQWKEFHDDGHTLYDKQNRAAYLNAFEDFLKTYLLN